MTEQHAESVGRAEPGPPPPGANQAKNEPFIDATDGPDPAPADAPEPAQTATDDAGRVHPGSPPAAVAAGVASPGQPQGVSTPGVHAARGTSEESEEVRGVSTTSLAAPGKPDGEVDTRA